jgi:GT2 family glycosyltransferase
MPLAYTIIVATYERAAALRDALASVAQQTHLPAKVVVVDASEGKASEEVCQAADIPIIYHRAEQASAALQRNQGFRDVETPLVAFIDDDVVLEADVFAKLCAVFDEKPETAGVAARMNGTEHPEPSNLLRRYYRLQAGYDDPTYGGKLFGAAINCFPCYRLQTDILIRSDWLNLGCVIFRSDAFGAELFPQFEGYSYGEDIHLSARVAKRGPLYFHASAWYEHFPSQSPAKRSAFRMAKMSARNRHLIARDIQGLHGWRLWWKDTLHRLFVTIYFLRTRPSRWPLMVAGTWS